MNKLVSLALPLLALAACAEPFGPGSTIEDERVLGVQVQVSGDVERSTPRAGETAHVELLTAGVDSQATLRWSLSVCVPVQGSQTQCAGPVLATASGQDQTPDLDVTVPAQATLGDAKSLLLLGMFCKRGTPAASATEARCVGDGAEGFPLQFELALARTEADDNLQPSLQTSTLSLAEQPWNALPSAQPDCRNQAGVPQLRADEKKHDITIELDPDAQELYLGADGKETREELQLSTFITAGELSRQFSFVERTDTSARPRVTVEWTAPKAKDLTTDQLAVRLILVVRDGRGGIAQLERSLCAVR